ncbi:hypothetical protein HYDPIDRAFT_110083 [Hydnomerulius pinastri MD-312]|nr:hypothetical protein HYDPIDRAFT_110083 [Hydnomerulius pinastri MD-312]
MALANVQLNELSGKLIKKDKNAFDHGMNADIWRGEYIDTTKMPRQVAIKVIRSVFTEDEVKRLNDKLLREARLWTTLKHVNIMPFLGITNDMTRNSAPSLVSPYYKNGNLKKYVTSKRLKDGQKMDLLCQIAGGLAYLHTCNVVHGDIKPGNILINDEGQAVLADFGLSRVLEVTGFTTKSVPGTIRYMAPELLNPNPTPETASGTIRTTKEADVWAFAVAATEIFSAKQPYHNKPNEGLVVVYVYRDAGTLKYDDYKSEIRDGVWSVLSACWDRSPSQRPAMDVIERFVRTKRDKYARTG